MINVGNVTASDNEYGTCRICNSGLVGQRTYIIVLDIGMYGEAHKICSKCRAGFDAADNELDGDKMEAAARLREIEDQVQMETSFEEDALMESYRQPVNEHWTFPRTR